MNKLTLVLLTLMLAACHDLRRADSKATAHATVAAPAAIGEFDNHEQVWRAREANAGAVAPPHVNVAIEATSQSDWSLWRIRMDASPAVEATWAIRTVRQADGALVMTPYRSLVATPAPAVAFDAQQWTPLDACALRGAPRAAADIAACIAIAPGIGASAALLPLAIERDGEWLRIRLYADQARGADAREDARRVMSFGGWAAVNGAGPKAAADSGDWHMDRTVRIGSEGGRYTLKWRDGSASGYSLGLERLTYRDGNVPVLKLSVIDDANGSALAYAWANPEATRIGINLGWVQVGLDREGIAPASTK